MLILFNRARVYEARALTVLEGLSSFYSCIILLDTLGISKV